MKKTICLILFLLFFGFTSLVVSAQTPPDQNFGTYEDLSYGGSVTYGLITYTGSDAYVGIGNTVSQGISLSPLFSGSAAVMGGNTSGGYVGFRSSSLSNNFKIVSFVADFYGHSNGNSSETYEIKGYDNGTEVVSVSNFIVTSSGSFGLGNATIGWVREDYDDNGSNSGTITFGSGWSNIDEIRFYPSDVAPNNNLFVGLDNIDFEPAVLPATAPSVTTNAASGISSFEVTLNGNVTSDGGALVTERGFIYSSTDNTPTIGEIGVTQVTDGSGAGVFSEAISGLNSSMTYYYQAYATNSEGTTYGGVVSFATSPTLGLEEDYLINAISLYPNPVNNVLYLSNNIKVEKIVLFDILGKTMGNIAIENNSINLSNIKTGIYLLKIETDRGSLVKRIIKD